MNRAPILLISLLLISLVLMSLATAAGAARTLTDDEVSERGSNPEEFSIATIKRGKQFFTVHCIRCHGTDGRGDTEMREFLKTAPADLSDGQWLYGGGDTAIFDVISRGRTERDMPAYDKELTETEIWQIISYIRYLGGQRP